VTEFASGYAFFAMLCTLPVF